jgi:hypothetical protein
MDFSAILQIKNKKFWWMDVIFYFVISLLVATILCYLIFLLKDYLQRQEIVSVTAALETVGTDQQKEQEQKVIKYQKKIADYVKLLENHQFASNVFAFFQKITFPDIWFDRFSLAKKGATVELTGEAEGNDAFSRQVELMEKNPYVKNLNVLGTSLDQPGRITFNLDVALDPKIFNYISDNPSSVTVTPSSEQIIKSNSNP